MQPILEAKIILVIMVYKIYLVFQPINRCFKKINKTKIISSWKSKGLFIDALKSPTVNNDSLAPKLTYIEERFFVKLDGSCLVKQNGLAFNKKY